MPVWILGSSTFGAQLAAHLGLPYAFASHFAPHEMVNAIQIYRRSFRPSEQLAKPYVMLGFNVFAADTQAEAELIASSWQQAFVNLRAGRPGKLPAPVKNYLGRTSPEETVLLQTALSCAAIGTESMVHEQIGQFLEKTKADELMIASGIFDIQARLRSYEILATACRLDTEESIANV